VKIVYLNYEDQVGRRFNGFDLTAHYNTAGHEAEMIVWEKTSDSKSVKRSFNFHKRKYLKAMGFYTDRYFGLPSMAYPFHLIWRKCFRKADVIHVHLMNNYYFNLFELPLISWFKPTVLTIHEFSPMTSHCVYPPPTCDKWKRGCFSCPDRLRLFPLYRKTEMLIWYIKKLVYSLSRIQLVVASDWMEERVKQSPLLNQFPIKKIPFGVKEELFIPVDTDVKLALREEMGIPADSIVIMFRAAESPFKGVPTILKALKDLKSDKKICLLTVQKFGMCDHLKEKFDVIDLGLIRDEILMSNAYKASDIFLMPSSDETFGMMSLEAMSCGLPVIVTKGTPLEEIGGSPASSIAVEVGNSRELQYNIENLVEDEDLRSMLGRKARSRVLEHFTFSKHSEEILKLYQKVMR
jgi:glycosyltransferase involved in cell wall biosynthesis